MENKAPTTNCKPSWTDQEIDRLGKALTFCYRNATDKFGNELDLEMRVDGFKFVLQDDYTMEQVLSAFKVFMKKSNKMIGTADIEKILSPAPTKITQSEFIHAKEQWKIENYAIYSYYAGVIRDYEAQEAESRDSEGLIECDEIKKIVQGSVKKIG